MTDYLSVVIIFQKVSNIGALSIQKQKQIREIRSIATQTAVNGECHSPRNHQLQIRIHAHKTIETITASGIKTSTDKGRSPSL